jgi:hypothetical protein
MKRALQALLFALCLATATAVPMHTWTDPHYGYHLTYPAGMNMITDGGALTRHFATRQPRFALAFTPPKSNDIGDDFMIVETHKAGHKSTAEFAKDQLASERKQGYPVVQPLAPVQINGQTFYHYQTNNGGTLVHNYIIVRKGEALDFMVEDMHPDATRHQAILAQVVRSIRF